MIKLQQKRDKWEDKLMITKEQSLIYFNKWGYVKDSYEKQLAKYKEWLKATNQQPYRIIFDKPLEEN